MRPSDWISVKERLPEDGQFILIYAPGNRESFLPVYVAARYNSQREKFYADQLSLSVPRNAVASWMEIVAPDPLDSPEIIAERNAEFRKLLAAGKEPYSDEYPQPVIR